MAIAIENTQHYVDFKLNNEWQKSHRVQWSMISQNVIGINRDKPSSHTIPQMHHISVSVLQDEFDNDNCGNQPCATIDAEENQNDTKNTQLP